MALQREEFKMPEPKVAGDVRGRRDGGLGAHVPWQHTGLPAIPSPESRYFLTLRNREFRRYFHVYLWRRGSDGPLKEDDHV